MSKARTKGKGKEAATGSRPGKSAGPATTPSSARLGAFYHTGPVLTLGGAVQRKVTVGRPGDAYEQEADTVAERVTAGTPSSAPAISRLSPGGLDGTAQRQTEEEEPVQTQVEEEPVQPQTEEEPVQRQEAEEPVQTQTEEEPVQRQAEEEEPVQKQEEEDSIQRQPEAEEPVQTQGDEEPIQRREEEKPVQRQGMDEEPIQRQKEEEAPVQRQEEEEPVQRQTDEEPVQTQADEEVQRQEKTEEEPVQRTGGRRPRVAPGTLATIRSPGLGQALPAGVRQRIEPHVGADLSGVHVHNDGRAHRAANSLQARAFTHRNHIFLGSGASGNDLPLLAHEATHVVQQGAAPVRASRPGISSAAPGVQRLIPDFIMEELNDYARHIPGYTLFTVIIGFNPLTGENVARNAINLLEGLMGLVPFGTLIFDALREHGIIQDAFAWVEGELGRLDLSTDRIERTLEAAWDDVRLLEGFDYNLQVLCRHFGRLYDDVVAFARSLVDHIIALIKDAAVDLAEELLAENKAWALLKKVLKYDPLKGEPVDATTVEILEDFLLLIGKEQELEQMREKGTLQETAAWLDTQLATFYSLLTELQSLFTAAWDAIRPENLPDLPTSLRNLAGRVGNFLQRAWDFATTVAAKVLALIKKSLLSWLSDFAHDVPGFHLVTVLLGKNPFTQEPVPRTAENIIKGFITLLPGGTQQYQQLQETGTIAQAAQRIEGAMAELGITWEFVTGLFTGIWESLSIEDLIDPIGAFQRIVNQFGEPISRLFAFIRVVLREIFMILLELMNFPTDIIARIISNAMQAFAAIKRDPVGFLKNMLRAVKLGFSNFFDNILQHLLSGVTEWLFGQLRKAGIEPPTELSLASVLDLVLQILGLSMERIWEKLAERIGQENVDRIRGAIDRLTGIWNFVRDVQERGMAAIWEYIESQISNLWDVVLEQVRNWIMERIITQVTAKLLSMLDPTGIMAVVNSFIAFFRAVQSAVEYFRAMLAIVDEYVSTIASVARGEVEPGAQKLEQGLANSIPVAIGFLANQVGLGNLADKIQEIVSGVRGLVDRALDWLLDRAVSMGQAVLRALTGAPGEADAADAAAGVTPEGEPAEGDGEYIYEKVEGEHTIKIRKDLKVFRFSQKTAVTGDSAQSIKQQELERLVSRQNPDYATDTLGRAAGPHGHVLGLKEGEDRESLPAVRTLPGGEPAYQPGDHRGHLIGDRFKGEASAGNLVPMHPTLNLSTFKRYENTLASKYKALENKDEAVLLYMHITPTYPKSDQTDPASYRPTNVGVGGTKIITLKQGANRLEAKEEPISGGPFSNPDSGEQRHPPVNLSTDKADKIAVLDGIGPVLAARIEANQPYNFYDDLLEVPGVGSGTIAEFRNDPLVRVRS